MMTSPQNTDLTYVSLFSGAGVGCHGFKMNGFECVATNELLEKRLNIQKHNKKCKYESGYVPGSLCESEVKDSILDQIELWKKSNSDNIDVVIATPPCQGMSVANHHKKNESDRNSLVVESLKMINQIMPKIAIFENVRSFLNTLCVDTDGQTKRICNAISDNLPDYNIHSEVINFKDYGNPSQRTRTIVICTRKDLKDITPLEIMPSLENEKTIRQMIGCLKPLKIMGDIDSKDVYHFYRPFEKRMIEWIKDLKEGESAFDNKKIGKIPHTIKNGKVNINQNKNKDKYRRCYWDKPMYCIHTRNDILASQMTIHPEDNRVFSIRELMKLMGIPDKFNWSELDQNKLNGLPLEEKRKFLKQEELNIRHCIGESVPTIIFDKIAYNAKIAIHSQNLKKKEIMEIIKTNNLETFGNLKKFVKKNIGKYTYDNLSKIIEFANSRKTENSAYYTPKGICFSLVGSLPKFDSDKHVRILEPSAGTGNFIPLLIEKYKHCEKITLDIIDIDENSIDLLKILEKKMAIPSNVTINYIHSDFLKYDPRDRYDIIIGNPPFKKITDNKELITHYKRGKFNTQTNNIFSFFIEHAIRYGDYISLITPKSLLSAPEFNKTRELMNNYNILKIADYGEKAFDIKIETVGFVLRTTKQKAANQIQIESHITNENKFVDQVYVTDGFPYWLIYRDKFFDGIQARMKFGIFTVFRDRQITNKILSKKGKYRVLKSRNIGSNEVKNVKGYDRYIDKAKLESLSVKKYLNVGQSVLIPNLTYLPRASFMPANSICDGSVAIATPRKDVKISKKTLAYYETDEFRQFYKIARNNSTRSMNIDSNSIYFFGKLLQ